MMWKTRDGTAVSVREIDTDVRVKGGEDFIMTGIFYKL